MRDPTTDGCTVTQTAFMLGLSREVTTRLLLRGLLTGHQIAGRWYIDRASIERLLRERGQSEAREAETVA